MADSEHHGHHMIPIWFFIGIIMLAYGVIILSSGIYRWVVPPDPAPPMFEYHADIWWGVLMLVLGTFYSTKFHPGKTAPVEGQKASPATDFT